MASSHPFAATQATASSRSASSCVPSRRYAAHALLAPCPLAERGSTAARYVADAITGLHLAPGDVPGTAAVLAQLFAGDETRRAMGNAGRSRVARTYTEAAMLDGFERAALAARDRTRARA